MADHVWLSALLDAVIAEHPGSLATCDDDPPLGQIVGLRYAGGAEIDIVTEVGMSCETDDGKWIQPEDIAEMQPVVCDPARGLCEVVTDEQAREVATEMLYMHPIGAMVSCWVDPARSATGRPFTPGSWRGRPTYTYTVDCAPHPDLCAHDAHPMSPAHHLVDGITRGA